jgi:hypothetical protein
MTASPTAHSPFDLVGSASLWMMLQWVDADVATSLLPPGLTLIAVDGAPPGQHPLLYSLGVQRDVKVACMPFGGSSYDETLFGVCSVGVPSATGPIGPYSYMTQLRLNDLLAMLIGRALGYPKDLSRIHAGGESYRIGTWLANATLLDARCAIDGRPFDETLGGFQTLRRLLAMPVISRSIFGTLLVSRFVIEPSGHVMRPADVSITVPTSDIHGIAPGTYHWPPVTSSSPGAVHSTHHWRLLKPRRFRSGSGPSSAD